MSAQISIASSRLRLRTTQESDLTFVLKTERHPENKPFIVPWAESEHRDALEDADIAHLICEKIATEQPVGYCIVAGLSNPHQSIEFKRIVIAQPGHGYGRDAVGLVKKLAFTEWNGNRLWLDVKEHNQRARRLYESEGFQIEGTLREGLKNGETFESLVVMSMLRREYLATSEASQ